MIRAKRQGKAAGSEDHVASDDSSLDDQSKAAGSEDHVASDDSSLDLQSKAAGAAQGAQ